MSCGKYDIVNAPSVQPNSQPSQTFHFGGILDEFLVVSSK